MAEKNSRKYIFLFVGKAFDETPARGYPWVVRAFIVTSGLAILLAANVAMAKSTKPTIAVLYFDYDGEGDMRYLRKGLAQMLVTDLADSASWQVVERTRLEAVLAELKLNQTNKIDRKSAAKIGKLLGAQFLVMGGYFDLGGALRVDARVVEVATGKIVASVGGHKKQDQFIELEQDLATQLQAGLRKKLHAKAATKAPKAARRRKRPKKMNTKTVAKYGKALDAMDHGHTKIARADLKALVAKHPDFQLAMIDLASLAK